MTSRPASRRPAGARMLLFGLAAASVLALPASADALEQASPCLADPTSCLTDPPQVDPCLTDPASCLPDLPPPDPCLEDPASCLPEAPESPDAPETDLCVDDPASCLPKAPDVDDCSDEPSRCMPGAPKLDPCDERPSACDPPDEDDENAVTVPPTRGGPRAGRDVRTERDERAERSTPARLDPQRGVRAAPIPSPRATAREGILERVGGGLADAAERFAFPLLLAVAVGAFLAVQGRFDRRDPKLVAAPVDARDDLVSFR